MTSSAIATTAEAVEAAHPVVTPDRSDCNMASGNGTTSDWSCYQMVCCLLAAFAGPETTSAEKVPETAGSS